MPRDISSATHIADACGLIAGAADAPTAELLAVEEVLSSDVMGTDAFPHGLVLRVPIRVAVLLSGMRLPDAARARVCRRVRALWLAAVRRAAGQLWLAGQPHMSAWRLRADALASAGSAGPWGAVGARWTGVALSVGPAWPSDDRECPVCFETFDCVLPAPGPDGRRAGDFACSHALCGACESALRGRPNDRCPLCRAGRAPRAPLTKDPPRAATASCQCSEP